MLASTDADEAEGSDDAASLAFVEATLAENSELLPRPTPSAVSASSVKTPADVLRHRTAPRATGAPGHRPASRAPSFDVRGGSAVHPLPGAPCSSRSPTVASYRDEAPSKGAACAGLRPAFGGRTPRVKATLRASDSSAHPAAASVRPPRASPRALAASPAEAKRAIGSRSTQRRNHASGARPGRARTSGLVRSAPPGAAARSR
jgi:hypothetical protein